MNFCTHGVPGGSYCRWCVEGGSPAVVAAEPLEVREARKSKIRREWLAAAAALPVRVGGARRGKVSR